MSEPTACKAFLPCFAAVEQRERQTPQPQPQQRPQRNSSTTSHQPGLPWPMSEGIQARTLTPTAAPKHSDSSTQSSIQANQQQRRRTPNSQPFSLRGGKPGAILVEAYAKILPKRTPQSSDKLQVEYTQFLVKALEQEQGTEKHALALLDVTDTALLSTRPPPWAPALLDSVTNLLQTHPTFLDRSNKVIQKRKKKTLAALLSLSEPNETTSSVQLTSTMDNQSAIADRLHGTNNNMRDILADVGPACTRSPSTFRELLAQIALTSGPVTEGSLASVIFFFSDKQQDAASAAAGEGLSSTLLTSILSGSNLNSAAATGWNLKSVATVLAEDYAGKDWAQVARHWDFPGFLIQNVQQFRTLLDLYRAAANTTPDLQAFTVQWRNTAGQLSILESIMNVPPAIFMCPLTEEELADAATAPPPGQSSSAPNPQCWASMQIVQRLLYLSDIPSLYRRVRDLFVKCLLTCPEVLLCSLVRLQLRVANAAQAVGESEPLANAGMQIKTELMRELIPLFFRPNAHHRVQNGPAALRRLYAISPSTVTAACFEAWRSTAQDVPQNRLATVVHIINIARLLPSPTEAVASLLNGSKDAEFSIAVAFVMSDNDYLQLKPWLGEKLGSKVSLGTFAVALVAYLRKTYTSAAPRAGHRAPLVSLENIVTSLQLLQSLDASILAQNITGVSADGQLAGGSTLGENTKSLIEACVAIYPSLRSSFAASAPPAGGQGAPPGGNVPASDDVEEQATAYFQKIYTSEQSIGEVVEMLKRFKSSGNSKENEIFACMVHNLFDEYRFFSKYPEKELRITGILFGALIQEQLVSSITLGIALRYVLEALRKPPSPPGSMTSSGKMFKFGMFALEQFKGRLHEWPQYCSHIVQIPHLKDGYADLVAEIEREMTKTQGRAPANGAIGSQSSVSSKDSLGMPSDASGGGLGLNAPVPVVPDAPLRVAEFGPKLGRAVTDGADEDREFEAPPDTILDRVQFLVNNLAPSNVEKKARELQEMLDPQYFGWLGHFLVVKRISTQANFHSLYLSFLDSLGEYGKGLVEAILASVYHSIGKLLRSPKITTSSSERSYLKNLGIWLGQITLSRNRPILQIMLDCKELLLQGYETGKLIAVAPFLAKTLEGAKNSRIFRPPNPWLMGILSVFRSVYNVEGLKMNIKFEVEVLCKNLSIKLEDIPLRSDILASRIAPVKERNPDFNIKAAQKSSSAGMSARGLGSPDAQSMALPVPPGPGEDAARAGAADQQDTVIPNLAAYVTVNPSLPQLLQGSVLGAVTTASLKRWVPIAVDRAIREIIQPVVERSVTIACITTKEIVTKDFAMEADEAKMRKAGQLMVANLAGSLALVTCREPLRSSVSTHLRQLLTSNLGRTDKLGEQEQNVIEQCVQICATDNIELGCMLIEKAATEKAVRDVDEALSVAMNARRKHREQTGQPFYDMSIFSNGNQRYPNALPDQLRPRPGGLRPEHFQLYDSFQRMPRQSQGLGVTAGGAGVGLPLARSSSSGSADIEGGLPSKPAGVQQFNTDGLSALAAKLDSAVSALLAAAGPRAAEIKLAMLPRDHLIRQLLLAAKQIMPNISPKGEVTRQLATSEEELVLGFSQGIFKRLYELNLSEPLRLEALVALLESINAYCPKLGKDMGTWATYAPTNTEPQRRLHRTVLLLLVRSRLLSVLDLDAFLAARANSGRDPTWVEFSLLFIRTAFMEQISTPADFPKLIILMSSIADGTSQAAPQVAQSYRKPINRMLEETRALGVSNEQQPVQSSENLGGVGAGAGEPREQSLEESSSLSSASLSNLSQAAKKVAETTEVVRRSDPANARQQVAQLLEGWMRLQSESVGNEKLIAQFLQVLQQIGVGKVEEQTERFLRLSTVIAVEAELKSATPNSAGTRMVMSYKVVDDYSKLLVLLFRHMNGGSSPEQVDAQRLGVLNKILGVIVRSMMWHSEKTKMGGSMNAWDQRPWFRLIMNLVIDLNKPDQAFGSIRLGILSVFGAAFHVCQPLVMSGFAFSWLELISHRHFLPNLLLCPGQKGWNTAHQLLVDHFLFLEPYLRRVELPAPVKKLYEGTLRVLLVLLHDFPSFLAAYHLSFCNVIPENCVQMRNIILSATPKGMSPPDPFTPNLKIDLLSEISQSPAILSNVLGPIEGIRGNLDAFLKDSQRRSLSGLLPMLYKEGTSEVDAARVNSLVLFVGAHALARLQNAQISLSRTPEMEIIQKLMDLDDRGRYTCLNAIANQLRYPSSHTHYFSCVMLYLFSETKSVAVKEQVTRVLLERLIVNRPHPWGLLITFIELIKNQRYGFWTFPFTRCATEIEKVFESVARSCMPPGPQLTALVGGEE